MARPLGEPSRRPDPVAVHLDDLVRDAVARFQAVAADKGQQLSAAIAGGGPMRGAVPAGSVAIRSRARGGPALHRAGPHDRDDDDGVRAAPGGRLRRDRHEWGLPSRHGDAHVPTFPMRRRLLAAQLLAAAAAGAVFGLGAGVVTTGIGLAFVASHGDPVALGVSTSPATSLGSASRRHFLAAAGAGLGALVRSQIGSIIAVFA